MWNNRKCLFVTKIIENMLYIYVHKQNRANSIYIDPALISLSG